MKKIFRVCGGFIIFILLIGFHSEVIAQEIKILPSLIVTGGYDDNIDYTRENKTDDYFVDIRPEFRLNYRTELLKTSAFARLDILRYFDETGFDRINQYYGINGDYDISPRWTANANFRFRKDETINSQLEETGRVFNRRTRYRYDAGGGLGYRLTELSDLGLDIAYRKNDYPSRGNVDNEAYRISLPYSRQFKDQRNKIFLTPAYTIFDSDNQEAHGARLTGRWQHLWSETESLNISLGGRFTHTKDKRNDDKDNNAGGVGRIDYRRRGETYSTAIGASHDLYADTAGELIQVNRIYLDFDKKFLVRFGVGFYGAGYLSDRLTGPDDKVRYFELRPSLFYLITENHRLFVEYSYQNRTDLDEPGNPDTQRNRVWVGLSLRFPKYWDSAFDFELD